MWLSRNLFRISSSSVNFLKIKNEIVCPTQKIDKAYENIDNKIINKKDDNNILLIKSRLEVCPKVNFCFSKRGFPYKAGHLEKRGGSSLPYQVAPLGGRRHGTKRPRAENDGTCRGFPPPGDLCRAAGPLGAT